MALFIDRFGDPFVTMADANGENAAKKIQEFFAVGILNVVIFGVIHHQGLVVIGGDTGKKIFFLFVEDFLFVHSFNQLSSCYLHSERCLCGAALLPLVGVWHRLIKKVSEARRAMTRRTEAYCFSTLT